MLIWSTIAWAAPETVEVTSTQADLTIDGVLDEAAWASALPHGDFLRFRPTDGGAPAGQTEVRFLQDDKNLYIAVDVRNVDYAIRAHVTPRESINTDDQIGVYLDTFKDGISGYIFYFNALGIQQDIRHNAGDWNVAWDTLLRSRGVQTDTGYTLEIALPWRSLKFPNTQDPQTWGLLVTRKIPGEGAKYGWPKQERGAPRLFQGANDLVGVQPPKRGSGLELIPSLTSGVGFPFPEAPKVLDIVRPSLDARFGITPDIGLAATLNPDFSQVESDVSDIRLNARFAFAFPERRPFFLDGIDWFRDPNNTLYTRSINEPIYGVKVSGREGPVSIGAMQVLDRNPLASFNEKRTPGFSEDDVEDALASTTLVRARVDAFDGGFAGVTLADKRLLGSSSTFQIAGADITVPLGNRWLGSGTQQHAFTSDGEDRLWGTRQSAEITRAEGIGTGGGLYFASNSAGYRNEIGFTTQSDRTDAGGWLNHTFTPDGIVDTFMPQAWLDVVEEGNGDHFYGLGGGGRLVLDGVHQFDANTWLQHYREGDGQVVGYGAGAAWEGNLGGAADLVVEGSGGRAIDYASQGPATVGNGSTTLFLRPTAGIQSQTTFTLNTFTSGTAPTLVSMLARNRVNWQFTRELGARWVLDYARRTDRDPRLYNALLLTWLRNPGTAFWLGGSVVKGEQGLEGAAFAKVTLLLRP